MEELLKQDSFINISQVKWFNLIADSTISVKDVLYCLTPNNNKRILVYKSGVLVGTANKQVND